VIWASSLVHPGVLEHARPGAEIIDSAELPLEGVLTVYRRALAEGLLVARVHSGDPALWGALQEQLDRCRELGLATSVVPGVSSFTAAAAAAGRELTIPEVAQSVILTRLGGGKTPMPPGEELAGLARHGTTWRCSCPRPGPGNCRRAAGGRLPAGDAVRVAYRVTWLGELVERCGWQLAATVKAMRLWKHAPLLVGPALAAGGTSRTCTTRAFPRVPQGRPGGRRALRPRGRRGGPRCRRAVPGNWLVR
jgi:precorrin-4/cobalt-precorrin-4 C11-methyltransferase